MVGRTLVGRIERANWTDLTGAYRVNRSAIVMYVAGLYVGGGGEIDRYVGNGVVGGDTAYSDGTDSVFTLIG